MKSLYTIVGITLVVLLLMFAGCDLLTKEPEGVGNVPQGDDLVISELFTLSPKQYYAFSWIEVFNTSPRTIDWFEEYRPAIGYVVGGGGTFRRPSRQI
jgi:hypothetical protein